MLYDFHLIINKNNDTIKSCLRVWMFKLNEWKKRKKMKDFDILLVVEPHITS